jgi:hypothetical protein
LPTGGNPGALAWTFVVVFQNGIANSDALITNIGPWIVAGGGNEFTDHVLTFMAKRTS